ncbi:methylglutaconyl-CoA hydratase [Sinosporangium album]|uniref:Methylglutaconyl-CoA hydratase n=1 Tax=Sinosporangium album TaxID=504805 RepID=A0A1G8CKN3_9ACTN|nr:enoyl-CoA hydratase/isomerase family protein [Sinosporangium album]SDH45998.1 methylglutaconyl-CoA hydratase [Sinosporangium album]
MTIIRPPTVTLRRQGPVAYLTLDLPRTGNALNILLLRELTAAVHELNRDDDIRVIVLAGAGDCFSVGGDVRELLDLADSDPGGRAVREAVERGREACQALSGARPITLARLHGKVFGAGLALAVHCDLRVAADDALFRLPELSLGMPPLWGGAGFRLISEIGASRTRELVYLCDTIDGRTALTYGLVHGLATPRDLDQTADRWARRLSRRRDTAVRLTKTALRAAEAAYRQGDLTLADGDLFHYGLRSMVTHVNLQETLSNT